MDDIRAIRVHASWQEEGAEQKSCSPLDQDGMGRDPQGNGQKVLQDGISNAMDGTEDDVVLTKESPEIDDDDIEENEFETDSEDKTDGE